MNFFRLANDLDEIEECASHNGWTFSWVNDDISVIAFRKQQFAISIQWTTGSVRTTLHRSRGRKSTVEREQCSLNQIKGILKNPRMNMVRHLDRLAREYGWECTRRDKYYGYISYIRHDCSMTVWYLNGFMIRTAMMHHRGKTQLFRRLKSLSMLRRIFDNPRTHSNRGYYAKTPEQTRRYLSRCRWFQ